jgi:3-hexulose-6-phosphate synthase
VQLALDVARLDVAMAIAEETVDFVDRFEVGTPLVLSEGVTRSISPLRTRFPGMPLVADCKIMDRGGQIARACIEAGASGVVVQAAAPYETIHAVREVANEYGAETLVDGLGIEEPATIMSRIGDLAVDHVVIHCGKDEQAVRGVLPLRALRAAALHPQMPPLAAAGGIDRATAAQCASVTGVKTIIVGEAIVGSRSPRTAAAEIRLMCDRAEVVV